MRKTLFLFCLLLFASTVLQAQNHLWGPTVSYQYQQGNTIKAGLYYARDINQTNVIKLDASANLLWSQHKTTLIPELALSYYSDMRSIAIFGRTELTPYTLTPKVGFSLFTLVEIDFGYGFDIDRKTNYAPIKGFSASLRFNVPLNAVI